MFLLFEDSAVLVPLNPWRFLPSGTYPITTVNARKGGPRATVGRMLALLPYARPSGRGPVTTTAPFVISTAGRDLKRSLATGFLPSVEMTC